MKLHLTEEESAFREEMRTFFTTEIPQQIRDTIAAGHHVGKEGVVQTQQILNRAGLAVPNWPVEWGGRDWTPLQRHIWHEEMQLACVPPPLAFNANMVGPVIANFGSQAQRERFLPPTANRVEPDPECALNLVPELGQVAPIQRLLTHSFGFGGSNAALIIGAI